MADNNPFPGENNTGHIWDDNLRELDNPAPRWWMIAFWASIIWVIGYAILYPMIPGLTGYSKGILGWTSIGEYKEGMKEVEAVRAKFESKLQNMSAKQILADEGLTNYTVASAKVLFGDNCAACHGSGGQGGPGFPVLADDDWLYGGDIDTIVQTITNGRMGVMPSHAKVLKPAEIEKLATAIMAGKPTSEPLFMAKACFACHGPDGKGMKAMGSANLTDAIWRFAEADQKASVVQTITHGVNDTSDPMTRHAIMPTFGGRLSKENINKLAVYVYKLGGGQ